MADTASVRRSLASMTVLQNLADELGVPATDLTSELGFNEDRIRARLTAEQEEQIRSKFSSGGAAPAAEPAPAATPDPVAEPRPILPLGDNDDSLLVQISDRLEEVAGALGGRLSGIDSLLRELLAEVRQANAREGAAPAEQTLEGLLYGYFVGFNPDEAQDDETVYNWLVAQFSKVLEEKPDTQFDQLTEAANKTAKASDNEDHLTPVRIRGAAAEAFQIKEPAEAGSDQPKSKRGLFRGLKITLDRGDSA